MAKKKGENRIIVNLSCPTCQEKVYTTTKNRKNDPGRIELNKYCPRCHKHMAFKEVK